MIILKPILILLSISGLSFYQNGKLKFIQNILFTLWLSSMILFATDFFLYIIKNTHNISAIFQDIMFLIGSVWILIKTLIYLSHRKSYLWLYNNLQAVVNLRHENGINIYELIEKKIRNYFNWYAATTNVAIFFTSFRPIFMIVYKYFQGTLSPSDWLQSIPTVLFAEIKTSPQYELIYLIILIAWYGHGLFIISVDSLFMGIGMYIIAGFKDVQQMILALDKIILNNSTEENSIDFIHDMKQCIKFHVYLLECQQKFQKINAKNIFISGTSLLLVVCCIVFRITKSKDEQFGILIVTAIAVNFMLLIYFYTGQLITTEGTNVANIAYNSLWYLCSSHERIHFLQIIQCSQRSRYLNGYFFDCSMETFSNIIKASFSVAAVMKNFD